MPRLGRANIEGAAAALGNARRRTRCVGASRLSMAWPGRDTTSPFDADIFIVMSRSKKDAFC